MRLSVTVEFLGAAGVGKSHIRERLTHALRSRGHLVLDSTEIRLGQFRSRGALEWLKASYLLYLVNPKLLFTYTRSARKIAHCTLLDKLSKKARCVGVVDEGIFHRVRGLQRRSPGRQMEDIAELMFLHIRAPDLVVVVEAAPDIVYERRLQRSRRSDVFSLDSVAADVQLVADSVSAIEHIQRTIAPHLKVVRVNVDGCDVNPIVEKLIGKVESLRRLSL